MLMTRSEAPPRTKRDPCRTSPEDPARGRWTAVVLEECAERESRGEQERESRASGFVTGAGAAGSVFIVSRDLVLVGAVSMALAGCASVSGPVLGRFGASGGKVDAWSADAVRCVWSTLSAGPVTMTSVVFAEKRGRSPSGGWVGTVVHSDGRSGPSTFVSAQRPGTFQPAKLHQETCARFEVAHHVQPDGTIGADVELDCDTGDGRRFVASLHAATCDRPPPTEGKL